MPQETYSVSSLDEDADEDRNAHTQYAPFENMLSAAHLIACLLQKPSTESSVLSKTSVARHYGFLGGFAMQLRGGRKSTRDIDVVTSLRMKGVWDAITGEERIVMPDSRLVEGIIKIFIKTDEPWDACSEQHQIEVDIKQAGFRKSPRKVDEHVEVVGPFDLFGQALYFSVLDIASMMRIKVECCLTREEPRDFEDVRFMITSHVSEVRRALQEGIVEEDDLSEILVNEKMGDESARGKLHRMLFGNEGQSAELDKQES